MKTVEYDATNKVLGRLAADIAITLRGKKTVTYRPDRLPDISVVVNHADKVAVTGTKETSKMYYRFSGYPGGLSKTRLSVVRAKHPDRLLYLAVRRMLPNNKLRAKLMKRLVLKVTA